MSKAKDIKAQKIENQHADEQLEVEGSEVTSQAESQQSNHQQTNKPAQKNEIQSSKPAILQGAYKASDYNNLQVSGEVKDLFKYITRYTPVSIELDTRLKAFIPDYIPTVGEVDAFIKMKRPDDVPQTLGLNILDEPSLNQSDRAKIRLLIDSTRKVYQDSKQNKIDAIENADKNPKQIMAWINSVQEIHKNKQAPSVSYSRPMPDIDSLMQVWPQQVEELLNDIKLPSEDIDLSLEEYCKMACNLVDIPVQNGNKERNVIESLHVMFTLYSAFKQNQHFQNNQSYVQNK